jgi:hypothetical protein
MILELVEFNSPKGWSRQQVAEEARNVIPKWRDNKELLRKHFLLELNGKTGAGVYIWPSIEAAKRRTTKTGGSRSSNVPVAHRRSGTLTCSCLSITKRVLSLNFLKRRKSRRTPRSEYLPSLDRACPGRRPLVREAGRGCPAQGRA